MSEDSAKRFEAIMDKLFRAPPKSSSENISTVSSSNMSGADFSRGKKLHNVSQMIDPKLRGKGTSGLQFSSGSSVGLMQTGSCRPWDRDDLFKRLATFKSMTWFAKPQAVSALNCARRGWINIDIDIIGCESCGARLLFSTPQSWTLQQVEKAAKVFSLKLDSGHKLLCPWVDNTCDESLAQFPPKPTDVLVEDFKYRCSALLQLSALPIISPSSIDCIRNSQLEEFLRGSAGMDKDESNNPCGRPSSESVSGTSASYYQAQKLISLFGWEPHSLPYIVDCKFQQEQCMKDVTLEDASTLALGGSDLNVCPLNDVNHSEVPERYAVSEPNSVALNCMFCGASVGLWAFSCVSRPLEFLRLVGYTDSSSKRAIDQLEDPAPGKVITDKENIRRSSEGTHSVFALSIPSYDKSSNLSLTIAGGPPPEKQNYRATISLPVIGRNLRGRFSMGSLATKCHDTSVAQASSTEQGNNQISESGSSLATTSESMQIVPQDSSKDGKLVENAESAQGVDFVPRNSHTSQSEGSDMSLEGNCTKGTDRAGETSAAIVLQTNGKQHALQERRSNGSTDGILLPVNNSTVPDDSGKRLDHKVINSSFAFDPIRQHRIFCPWITSYGNSAPGWEQTLFPLLQHKQISSRASLEVDDPIALVKRLFSSPSAKRTKYAHTS